jgi:hypothetical protein
MGPSQVYDRDVRETANEFAEAHGLNGPPLLRDAVWTGTGTLAKLELLGTPR